MAARVTRRPHGIATVSVLSALAASAALAGCRSSKVLTGRVLDYDTRRPIASAAIRADQNGWGWSSGLVWDKTYTSTASSDASGHFSLRYRVGDSANLVVAADGYSEWRHWYAAGDNAEVFLRARPANPIRSNQLSFGVNTDGTPFGWSFDVARTTTEQPAADIFPDPVSTDVNTIRLLAGERGGFRVRSRRDLRVDGDTLIFAPPAPPDNYVSSVTIALGDADASREGVYFVKTRDGAHFAKFEVGPNLTTGSGLGVRQSFFFTYVYDPAGGRDLPFEHAPLMTIR